MAITNGLRVYDGAQFAHALQTEMDPTPADVPARPDKKPGKDRLPARGRASQFASKLRKAMANAVHAKAGSAIDDMMVVLVDTPNRAVRDTIRDIVEHVPAMVEARQGKLTNEAIDALVSVYMRAPPNADVERLLYDSNAKARARFLEEWPCFTAKELSAIAGHGSKNKSMTASRWKTKNKVFSVKHAGAEYFPAFQFEDGQPVETVGKVITILGEKKSGWQLAFWFTSPNGWLDGTRPADVLKEADSIARAAAHEAENISG